MAPTVWRWVVATAFLWRPMVRGGAAELGPYCAKGSCGYLSRCGQVRQQFRWTWTASIAQGYLVWCCMRCITSTSRVCDGSDLTGRLALAEPSPVVLAPCPLQFEDLLTSGLRWDWSSPRPVNIVLSPCGAIAAEPALRGSVSRGLPPGSGSSGRSATVRSAELGSRRLCSPPIERSVAASLH